MDKILLVSADGHAGAPPEEYRDYLESKFHEELDELVAEDKVWNENAITQSRFGEETLQLIDRGDAIRGGGELGAYDIEVRLKELDREGVAAEIIIPGHQVAMLPFFGVINRPASPELRTAGIGAYHRHLAEGLAASGGRLYGIADPGPCLDMDATVTELKWVAAHNFVGVAPPGQVHDPDLPALTSDYYEPFWSACEELSLALNIHAGWGLGQFGAAIAPDLMNEMTPEEKLRLQMTADISIDQFPKDSPARMALTKPRRALWQLMMSGVFDRHPDLSLVFTEVRADWIPATLTVLDAYFEKDRRGLTKRPSDYWAQHCYAAPSSPRPYEIALRGEIGVDRLMFGMDYPHPEGTWPNTREWLQLALAGVDETDARKILGLNAVSCYGLDAKHLSAVADKIGLYPQDVLGGPGLDERVIEQFHSRSGFSRPAERVDESFYVEMIDEDQAAFAAS